MISLNNLFTGILLLLLSISCSKNSSKLFTKKKIQAIEINSDLIRKQNFSINYNKESIVKSITLKYLGSGGYYFSDGEAALIIDPFFSPYQVVPLALKKISTQTENVEKGLYDIKNEVKSNVEAIFITHSHYDHLLDASYVFNHYLDTTKAAAKIYGSSSTKILVSSVVDSTYLENIENNVGSHSSIGDWIYLNKGRIRVMPIQTRHAPHLKKLFSINLYRGEAKPIKNYDSDSSKTFVTKWKGGCTFAYLIDFMVNDKPDFRIYLLSSASSPPDGFIAQETLAEHEVNLAILGAASSGNVQNYPQGILQHIKPEKLIIAHWEDLFKPYQHDPPRLIRATNFKKLIPGINEVYPFKKNEEQQFYMPAPGVFVRLEY
jgi:ribonuclease BN (tRNA processing enzyme)